MYLQLKVPFSVCALLSSGTSVTGVKFVDVSWELEVLVLQNVHQGFVICLDSKFPSIHILIKTDATMNDTEQFLFYLRIILLTVFSLCLKCLKYLRTGSLVISCFTWFSAVSCSSALCHSTSVSSRWVRNFLR